MTRLMHRVLRSFTALAIGGAVLAAGGLATNPVALSQERTAAPPKEVIFARKILMDTINNNMDEIEGMISSGKEIPLEEAQEHADTISVMLMAFPHLFPARTNQWKPNVKRDPGTDTFASPDVWRKYADFHKRAADASKIAYRASRAEDWGAFKTFAAELRVACDSCHGLYLKKE